MYDSPLPISCTELLTCIRSQILSAEHLEVEYAHQTSPRDKLAAAMLWGLEGAKPKFASKRSKRLSSYSVRGG